MKSIGIIMLLSLLGGCTTQEVEDKIESTDSTAEFHGLLNSVTKTDIAGRRKSAADLCIIMLKRNQLWRTDPWDWKIPTEEGIRMEVKSVRSSQQEPDLAIANVKRRLK